MAVTLWWEILQSMAVINDDALCVVCLCACLSVTIDLSRTALERVSGIVEVCCIKNTASYLLAIIYYLVKGKLQ